jgi:hypothetical protein
MNRRVASFTAILTLSFLAAGCGRFAQQDGGRLVKSVGPDRLREAAASVRLRVAVPTTEGECRDVPEELLPDALRDLEAQNVCVRANGLMITKYMFFVEAEGLFIVFDGAELPKEDGGDPAFRRLSDRIYWFQFTG